MFRHLGTGGWWKNHYAWNDPNMVNLWLAIVEPAAVLTVVAYWIWRTRPLYRALFVSFIVQLLVVAGFAALFVFFFLNWKPKLM